MTSDYTMANFGGISQGEADFGNVYSGLQNQLNDLDSNLQKNLSEWTGAAQQAYQVCKAQWTQAADNCAMILQNLQGVIGDAHSNYTTAESHNSALWGQ